MKRAPKLTSKERKEKQGRGPAQAHFTAGQAHTYVSPTTVKKRTTVMTPAVTPSTNTIEPECCPWPRPKFKTVSKKEKKYVCRRCGTVVQNRTTRLLR